MTENNFSDADINWEYGDDVIHTIFIFSFVSFFVNIFCRYGKCFREGFIFANFASSGYLSVPSFKALVCRRILLQWTLILVLLWR